MAPTHTPLLWFVHCKITTCLYLAPGQEILKKWTSSLCDGHSGKRRPASSPVSWCHITSREYQEEAWLSPQLWLCSLPFFLIQKSKLLHGKRGCQSYYSHSCPRPTKLLCSHKAISTPGQQSWSLKQWKTLSRTSPWRLPFHGALEGELGYRTPQGWWEGGHLEREDNRGGTG